MVITNLTGGLGNQMFQYAAGRSVAVRNNTRLKYFFTDALFCTSRKFGLSCFSLNLSIARSEELKRLRVPVQKLTRLLFNFLGKFPFICKIVNRYYLQENNYYDFDKRLGIANNNVYLVGFWQNEKYFEGVDKELRKDFKFKIQTSHTSIKLLKEIASCNSVSVHVRGGDYIKDPKLRKIYDVCDEKYYKLAIEKIKKSVDRPVFYIFTNDEEYTRSIIHLKENIIFVDNTNNRQDFEDMMIMSKCKHNIIANSTFSWWAAWLNENPNKKVYGPPRWTNNESKIHPLLSSDWITKISNLRDF